MVWSKANKKGDQIRKIQSVHKYLFGLFVGKYFCCSFKQKRSKLICSCTLEIDTGFWTSTNWTGFSEWRQLYTYSMLDKTSSLCKYSSWERSLSIDWSTSNDMMFCNCRRISCTVDSKLTFVKRVGSLESEWKMWRVTDCWSCSICWVVRCWICLQ